MRLGCGVRMGAVGNRPNPIFAVSRLIATAGAPRRCVARTASGATAPVARILTGDGDAEVGSRAVRDVDAQTAEIA